MHMGGIDPARSDDHRKQQIKASKDIATVLFFIATQVTMIECRLKPMPFFQFNININLLCGFRHLR